MKVKEKDLVIGDEYWMDEIDGTKGVFIGCIDDSMWFYPTNDTTHWEVEDGLIVFDNFGFSYEEV